jgi:hypothetical protein
MYLPAMEKQSEQVSTVSKMAADALKNINTQTIDSDPCNAIEQEMIDFIKNNRDLFIENGVENLINSRLDEAGFNTLKIDIENNEEIILKDNIKIQKFSNIFNSLSTKMYNFIEIYKCKHLMQYRYLELRYYSLLKINDKNTKIIESLKNKMFKFEEGKFNDFLGPDTVKAFETIRIIFTYAENYRDAISTLKTSEISNFLKTNPDICLFFDNLQKTRSISNSNIDIYINNLPQLNYIEINKTQTEAELVENKNKQFVKKFFEIFKFYLDKDKNNLNPELDQELQKIDALLTEHENKHFDYTLNSSNKLILMKNNENKGFIQWSSVNLDEINIFLKFINDNSNLLEHDNSAIKNRFWTLNNRAKDVEKLNLNEEKLKQAQEIEIYLEFYKNSEKIKNGDLIQIDLTILEKIPQFSELEGYINAPNYADLKNGGRLDVEQLKKNYAAHQNTKKFLDDNIKEGENKTLVLPLKGSPSKHKGHTQKITILSDDSNCDDIVQGQTGNCFFLGTLAAITKSKENKELLKSMIKQMPNGNYQVQLFLPYKEEKLKSIWVEVSQEDVLKNDPTLTNTTKRGVYWPRIIELAFNRVYKENKLHENQNPIFAYKVLTGKTNSEVFKISSLNTFISKQKCTTLNEAFTKVLNENKNVVLSTHDESYFKKQKFQLKAKEPGQLESFFEHNGKVIVASHSYVLTQNSKKEFIYHNPHGTNHLTWDISDLPAIFHLLYLL